MKLKDQKDIANSKLVDITEGHSTTGFVFERKDGTKHGFRVPTKSIELVDFKQLTKY